MAAISAVETWSLMKLAHANKAVAVAAAVEDMAAAVVAVDMAAVVVAVEATVAAAAVVAAGAVTFAVTRATTKPGSTLNSDCLTRGTRSPFLFYREPKPGTASPHTAAR